MDPHRPQRTQARPVLPFFMTVANPDAEEQKAENGGFAFDLDYDDAALGRPIVTRLGAYRRGFRKSGPEIGEGKNVNG